MQKAFFQGGIFPGVFYHTSQKHLFYEVNLTLYYVDNLLNEIHNLIGLFHNADPPIDLRS